MRMVEMSRRDVGSGHSRVGVRSCRPDEAAFAVGKLRAARRPSTRSGVRIIRAADYDTAEHLDDESTLVIDGQWTYQGTGWLTLADAALANAAAAAARERRPAVARS